MNITVLELNYLFHTKFARKRSILISINIIATLSE